MAGGGGLDLIAAFEEEQKTVVFSALSDYLHSAVFTDVSLVCGNGHQRLRAHKVVLASSCKFFRDTFKHSPGVNCIDLDKELAPNGLSLTFEDVELIIGILYCVGTVEISPQRVAALLLAAQVMGIPSLIRFLKRIKESIMTETAQSTTSSLSQLLAPPPQTHQPLGHSERGASPPPSFPPLGVATAAGGSAVGGGGKKPSHPLKPNFVYLIPPSAAAAAATAAAAQQVPQQSAPPPSLPPPPPAPTVANSPPQITNTSFTGPHDVTLSSSGIPGTSQQSGNPGGGQTRLIKPMTESCLNTPAPPPPPITEFRAMSAVAANVARHSLSFVSPAPPGAMPNKQERIEDFRGRSATPSGGSRPVSRATLASLGSFSLGQGGPLATSPPLAREIANQSSGTNKGVTSVLEGLDPNFLSQINFQSMQYDDLESAILPHFNFPPSAAVRDSNSSAANLVAAAEITGRRITEPRLDLAAAIGGQQQPLPTSCQANPTVFINSTATSSENQAGPSGLCSEGGQEIQQPIKMNTAGAQPSSVGAPQPSGVDLQQQSSPGPSFGTSFNSSSEETRISHRTGLLEVTPQELVALESRATANSIASKSGLVQQQKLPDIPIPPNGCSTPLPSMPPSSVSGGGAVMPKITIAPMGKCSSANISLNELQQKSSSVESENPGVSQTAQLPSNLHSPQKAFAINFQPDSQDTDMMRSPPEDCRATPFVSNSTLSDNPVTVQMNPPSSSVASQKQPPTPYDIHHQPGTPASGSNSGYISLQPLTPDDLNMSQNSSQAPILGEDPFSPSGVSVPEDHPLNSSQQSTEMGGSNPTECRNNRSQPQPAGTVADSPNEGPSLKHPQQQSEGSTHRDPGTHSYQHNQSARDEKVSSKNQPKVAPVVQQQFLDIGSPAPAADEIKVALNSVHEGQSFKFSIPGTSQSVTLNFSADALAKMRNCVSLSQEGGVASSMDSLGPIDTEMSTMEVTSSTGVGGGGGTSKGSEVREVTLPEDQSGPEDAQEPAVEARVATKLAKNKKKKGRNVGSGGEGGKTGGGIRTKSRYQCQLCPKQYPTQKLLDKHVMFHVDQNAACSQCGKLFYKRWMLEQHMAVDHGAEQPVKCKDCDKTFKWHRNLLAHIMLVHQQEVRYRCRICPLTFLRKKSYIKHHKSKHANSPETWCKYCLEIFDHNRSQMDHTCDGVENNGQQTICHRHEDGPRVFTHQDELFAHFNEHHDDLDAAKEGGLEIGDGGWKHAQKKKKLMMTSAASSASASASTLTPMASGLSSAGPSGGGLGGGASSVSVQASNRRPPQLQHGCPVCHKKFLLKKNLLSHIKRYHEDEGKVGQYHCTICSKGFFYDKDRLMHENVHRGEKSFKCQCGKSYSSNKALKDHVKMVHEDTTVHSCHICGKQLRDKYKLKYHMMVHTDKRNFKCGYCPAQFKGRENLKKHVAKVHHHKVEPGISGEAMESPDVSQGANATEPPDEK